MKLYKSQSNYALKNSKKISRATLTMLIIDKARPYDSTYAFLISKRSIKTVHVQVYSIYESLAQI